MKTEALHFLNICMYQSHCCCFIIINWKGFHFAVFMQCLFLFITLILLQTLMKNYSSSLGIAADSCLAALQELQQHALDRLRERDHFRETGLATIRVRVPDKNHSRRILSLETKLSATVQEVQQAVASQIGVECDRYLNFVLV